MVAGFAGRRSGHRPGTPSNGISLVLTFWVSCGLLVDGLDLAPEIGELLRYRAEVRELDLRRKAIQARLDEIEIELDDVA